MDSCVDPSLHGAQAASLALSALQAAGQGTLLWEHLGSRSSEDPCPWHPPHSTPYAAFRSVCYELWQLSYPLIKELKALALGDSRHHDAKLHGSTTIAMIVSYHTTDQVCQSTEEGIQALFQQQKSHHPVNHVFTDDPSSWPPAQQEQQDQVKAFLGRLAYLECATIHLLPGGTSQLIQLLGQGCLPPCLRHLTIDFGFTDQALQEHMLRYSRCFPLAPVLIFPSQQCSCVWKRNIM